MSCSECCGVVTFSFTVQIMVIYSGYFLVTSANDYIIFHHGAIYSNVLHNAARHMPQFL